MSEGVAIQIGQELLLVAMMLVLPAVAVSLIVGLVISVLQTVTSIQEQTLTFAPRIVAVGATLMVTAPWMLRVLNQFTMRMLMHAAGASE